MKFLPKLLLLITIICPQLSRAQIVSPTLEEYNQSRVVIDLSLLEDGDIDYIENTLQMERVYTSSIDFVAIYVPTVIPLDLGYIVLNDILDITNNMREETGQGAPGTTERDNLDLKFKITGFNSSGPGNGFSTPICSPFDYDIQPMKNKRRTKVAVFDTGINSTFDNLSVPGLKQVYNETFDGLGSIFNTAIDDNNHGTHVAYTISNIANSTYNPYIKFYDYKIMDEDGYGYLSDLVMAVDKAVVEHQVNILNLSVSSTNQGNLSLLTKYFKAVAQKNVIIITSAGNESKDLGNNNVFGLSSEVGAVINVGSLNCKSQKSKFSNYGESIDIYVQGENINSLDQDGNPLEYSGTSQATAVLTGFAAALSSYQTVFDAGELECAIYESQEIPNLNYPNMLPTVDADLALGALQGECSSNQKMMDEDNYLAIPTGATISQGIFPNPASGQYTITLSKGRYQVIVMDMMGRVIEEISMINEYNENTAAIQIDEKYQDGLHIIVATDLLTNHKHTHKLIINK